MQPEQREGERPTVRYGCHSCLAGYDWPAEVADPEKPWECPFCGDGFGAPMPADEQPTIEARRYVQWVLERQEP
ncbi:MAG TPA: hypothetical protein VLA89_08755 [Gemmatimonadales bacterium]|nr:hypothetical protein [Gemmatimonadales bacterium]